MNFSEFAKWECNAEIKPVSQCYTKYSHLTTTQNNKFLIPHSKIKHHMNSFFEGDTPPPFCTKYSGVLDGTQYAKGRYAVRKNPVMSYADINFYFKKVQFSF